MGDFCHLPETHPSATRLRGARDVGCYIHSGTLSVVLFMLTVHMRYYSDRGTKMSATVISAIVQGY